MQSALMHSRKKPAKRSCNRKRMPCHTVMQVTKLLTEQKCPTLAQIQFGSFQGNIRKAVSSRVFLI
ncbi:hypothetical protein HAX54_030527, partial [Datura stramonium]|nr:hypothetical protein [Datura stramonium]